MGLFGLFVLQYFVISSLHHLAGEERELVAFLLLRPECHMSLLSFFLTVPRGGMGWSRPQDKSA